MDYTYIIVFESTFVYVMISLPDDALTARLITDIDYMVHSIVISDIVRPLDPKGKKFRRKIKCSLWSSMYVEVCIYYIDSTTTIVHKYYTAPEMMLKREYVYVHTGIIKLFQNLTVI